MNDPYKVFARVPTVAEKFNAALLAQRCLGASAQDRTLVFFIQSIVVDKSRKETLAAFLARFRQAFPQAISIPGMDSMRADGGYYNADQVRMLRAVVGVRFPLRGEPREEDYISALLGYEDTPRLATSHPSKYLKSDFEQMVASGWKDLENVVTKFCLECEFNGSNPEPWWWVEAKRCLGLFMELILEARRASAVHTTVGKLVFDTLDAALATGGLVMIDGEARVGKTFATKHWCDLHPAQARYVQTPCAPNEQSFLAAIADAIGIPVGASSNFGVIRARIETVLQEMKLMLVFDEGHYLMAPGRYTMPHRLAWILTALTNMGCACAIVTTPQFLKAQEEIAKRTNWNFFQFAGRVMLHQPLPKKLDREELLAVARHEFPDAPDRLVQAIVGYAEKSHAYIQALAFVKKLAQVAASKAERAIASLADIQSALKTLNQSGNAIADRLQTSSRGIEKTKAPRGIRTAAPASVPVARENAPTEFASDRFSRAVVPLETVEA